MSRNRTLLKQYFFRVTEDLLARGVIARKTGQNIEDLLRREIGTVLSEVESDLIAVAAELGFGLAYSASKAIETMVRGEIERVARSSRAVVDEFLRKKK